ncbi:hypothetical protein BF93_05095 [Brachybacterium phenoliresistens]|uniref:HTH lacI-type domain-containing protein n=1 Tax=Brachybacterium phenoliresistens TaxID=396014 RepID=Z9JQ48_9MICO|nr:LacI family DNA-binding transcriptional regulator [Brachybacterium phenoliresistens]EWS80133.1 hypothetical protein BF93_05095 [Brachybacterium phenoliresistens]
MTQPDGRRRGVTLSEVARRAHVSVAVVSKVVNARPGVSPATRAHVQEVLHELSYTAQRNVAARSRLVDVVVPDLHSSWMNQLMTGMHAAARAADVALVVTIESAQAWMSAAAARGTAGVIRVLDTFDQEELAWLRAHDVAFAEVASRRTDAAGVAHIEATDELSGQQATEELIAQGHSRILYAGGRGTPADLLRRAGYERAMREAGLADRIRATSGWSLYGATEQTRSALDAHRPTAIVAWADQIALAIMHEAHRLGRVLPRDLSVVGFDDLPESEGAYPRLTTVHVPVQEMGAAAVRAVTEPGGAAAMPRRLATHLVRRESVAPPPPSPPSPSPPSPPPPPLLPPSPPRS